MKLILNLIKIISIIFVSCALGLDAWQIYMQLHHVSLPSQLEYLFWIGNIIMIAHAIEGIIAAFKAKSQKQNPLTYGIYTFFVGFVGIQELVKNK
jgi:hypothetical protein